MAGLGVAAEGSDDPLGSLEWQRRESPALLSDLAAITGGTGFLGGFLVDALLRAGWRVRVLARREAVFPAGVEVVQGLETK